MRGVMLLHYDLEATCLVKINFALLPFFVKSLLGTLTDGRGSKQKRRKADSVDAT